MTDGIKAALTWQEWHSPMVMFREGKGPRDDGYGIELLLHPARTIPPFQRPTKDDWAVVFDGSWSVALGDETRHKLAAIALYGHPQGFTHDDVEALRNICADLAPNNQPFFSIMGRIAALLPPSNAARLTPRYFVPKDDGSHENAYRHPNHTDR